MSEKKLIITLTALLACVWFLLSVLSILIALSGGLAIQASVGLPMVR